MNPLFIRRRYHNLRSSIFKAVTRAQNPDLMTALWTLFGTNGVDTAGIIHNENYVTLEEAHNIVFTYITAGSDSSGFRHNSFYYYDSTKSEYVRLRFQSFNELPYFDNINNNFGHLFADTNGFNIVNSYNNVLTDVTVPNIEDWTKMQEFLIGCSALQNVTFPINCKFDTLAGGFFEYSTITNSISLPKNIKTIQPSAFYNTVCPLLIFNDVYGSYFTNENGVGCRVQDMVSMGNVIGSFQESPGTDITKRVYIPKSVLDAHPSYRLTGYVHMGQNTKVSYSSTYYYKIVDFDDNYYSEALSDYIPSNIQTEIERYKITYLAS